MTKKLLGSFTAAVLLVFCAGGTTTWAIPTQALNPHDDSAGAIAYLSALPGAPDTKNHSHVAGIGVKEVGGKMVDNAATPQWISEAAWDDRFLRFADANNDNANDLLGTYGHGYIDPAFRPRYRFDAADYGGAGFTLATLQSRFADTWSAWDTAAKQQGQNTRTAPNASPLSTSVAFQDVGTAAAAEILIDFIPGMQTAGGPFAEWVISGTQANAANGNAAPRTLVIEPNPTTKLFVNDPGNPFNVHPDWDVSTDGGTTFAARTPAIALSWNFTAAAPTNLAQQVKYKCINAAGCGAGVGANTTWNGNEAAFTALGLQVADSAGGALEAANNKPFFQADFLSVSLHEWGHLIGLLHSPGGIMNAADPFTLNVLTRTIDVNNAKGAAVLYSIPVPEPGTLALLVVAMVGFAVRVRRA